MQPQMSAAPAAKPATTPASAAAAAAPKRLFMGSQLPLIKFVVLGGVWTHLFMSNCYTVRKTIGPSMLPTLNVRGDWVLISKLNKLGRGLRVGDLVSYKHPVEADIGVIKRVIGMPGDFVVKDPTDGSGDMLQVR